MSNVEDPILVVRATAYYQVGGSYVALLEAFFVCVFNYQFLELPK